MKYFLQRLLHFFQKIKVMFSNLNLYNVRAIEETVKDILKSHPPSTFREWLQHNDYEDWPLELTHTEDYIELDLTPAFVGLGSEDDIYHELENKACIFSLRFYIYFWKDCFFACFVLLYFEWAFVSIQKSILYLLSVFFVWLVFHDFVSEFAHPFCHH